MTRREVLEKIITFGYCHDISCEQCPIALECLLSQSGLVDLANELLVQDLIAGFLTDCEIGSEMEGKSGDYGGK
jgi:hypothetical protein